MIFSVDLIALSAPVSLRSVSTLKVVKGGLAQKVL